MASSSAKTNLTRAKTVVSTVLSVAATTMVVRSIVQEFMPHEFQDLIFSGIRNLFNNLSTQMTMVIDEFDGLVNNQIYEAAEVYLGGKVSPSTQRLKVSKPEKEKSFTITMEPDETMLDVFNGIQFKWVLICREDSKNSHNSRDFNSTLRSQLRSFELSFHRKHLDFVLKSYLPHILRESKLAQQEKKTLKIFTFDFYETWVPTNLDHPSTFETLAMDPQIKNFIIEDLERFVRRKDYYKKVGKAWKRGYLLYGPPGTGKSSLIAAMANYLNFDVYDLELTEIDSDSELKKLLIAMGNRSIMVVEDIDCMVDFEDRNKAAESASPSSNGYNENQVTLSGLLNFIDGLWSSCGDERIIIFTTNHRERLDPALLRPGRMDVHIHMSYCTPCGFRLLAANYLGIKEHTLFAEIEQQIKSTEVTPAEVAEELLKSDNPEVALQGLIGFLKVKKKENEEAKAKKAKEAEEVKGKKEKEVAKTNRGNKKDGDEAESEAKEIRSIIVDKETEAAKELIESDHLEVALQGIVDLLKLRKKGNGKAKAKKENEGAETCKEGDEKDVEAEAESESKANEVKSLVGDEKDVEEESE